MRYEIDGPPVAWCTHRGYGKKSFNPHFREKEAARWQLAIQHAKRPLYNRAVRADFFFEMPIPASLPKKIRKRIEAGEKIYHDKRPDRDNLQKHCSDCLTSAVVADDNLIAAGESQKYYSLKPKTVIIIQEL